MTNNGAGQTKDEANKLTEIMMNGTKVGILSLSIYDKPDNDCLNFYDFDRTGPILNRVYEAVKLVDFLIVNIEWPIEKTAKTPLSKIRRLARNMALSGVKIINGVSDANLVPEIIENCLVVWGLGTMSKGSTVIVEPKMKLVPYETNYLTDYLWYWMGYKQMQASFTTTILNQTRKVNTK